MKFACILFVATFVIAGPAKAEPPLAVVNDVVIQRAELDAAIEASRRAGAEMTPALSASLRDRIVAEALVWQGAQAAGFDSPALTGGSVERARRMAAIEAYVASRIQVIEPTEDALRARFDDIVGRLGPREFRISLIQTPDEAALRAAASRIARGSDFAHEARTSSRVPSAARGGELGWVTFPPPARQGLTNGVPLAIAESIGDLQPGQTSPPIRVGESWALVRVDAVRDTLVPDYHSVRSSLRKAFHMESMQAQSRQLIVDLMRHARVRVVEGGRQ